MIPASAISTKFLVAACCMVACTVASQTVDKVEVSSTRGFYSQAFSVALGCNTPGTEIRYTTDGSTPTATTGTVFTMPVPVNGTTILRAAGFKLGFSPSKVTTHTYIFLSDVVLQSPNGQVPPGFPPSGVNGQVMDYGMDPEIVSHPQWGPLLDDALLAIPSISVVTDSANLFDPATGIYVNAQDRPDGSGLGDDWERPASIELLYPPGITPPAGKKKGFQENGGIRMRGNFSRQDNTAKHGFKVLFKNKYGAGKLDYPLFGNDGPRKIDRFDLRTMQDHAWSNPYYWDANMHAVQDPFCRLLMRDLRQPWTRGFFVHLYLNGQYWGLYNTEERPMGGFAEDYLGGGEDDYDVLKVDATAGYTVVATEGTNAAWQSLFNKAVAGFSTDAAFFDIMGRDANGADDPARPVLLDMQNHVDYMMMNFYVGNHDGPISADLSNILPNNFFVLRNRTDRHRRGFVAVTHDMERTVLDIGEDRHITSSVGNQLQYFNSQWLHIRLMQNAEYKVRFGDRVHRAFFNGGPCMAPRSLARFSALADEIALAIIGESARWGDANGEPPRTKAHWDAAVASWKTGYFPVRSGIALGQFQSKGLYPAVSAPVFSQHGGPLPEGGLMLAITDANSGTRTIYYTTDGTDPRALGGGVAGAPYTAPIVLPGSASKSVKARVQTGAGAWSALNEALFSVPMGALRITEVMFNPAAPTAAEIAAGFADADEFEFIELQNTGAVPLNLPGCRFTAGVDFEFGDIALAPGAFVVIARNRSAFLLRHGMSAAGEYLGDLHNAGDHLTLVDGTGSVLHDFDFSDGWFPHTDGTGFSLVPRDPSAPPSALQSKAGWRASNSTGGSPGAEDPAMPAPGTVVFSEILTIAQGAPGRWIELRNTSAQAVSIGEWFLSDDAAVLAKYRFPAGTSIPAGGRLLVFEDTNFGPAAADPGRLVPFSLGEHGGNLWLCSSGGGEPGGYREHVDFGAAENGVSFGRYLRGDGNTDFPILAVPTFDADNAPPRIGPVVISEILYHPPADGAEFIELRNLTGSPVALDGWRITGGIEFTIPAGTTLAAHGYAVLTGGDPAAFRAAHSIPPPVPVLGPWDGILDNDGEQAELKRPTGIADFLSIDRVNFSEDLPWPPASGDGHALVRQPVRSYGNDAVNWLTLAPTPGSANTADTDGDSLPDDWETANSLDPSSDDSALDADTDSQSNAAEFVAGTDPRDPTSVFRIGSVEKSEGGIHISFTAQPGRTYTVQFRDDLATGAWLKFADIPAQPAAGTVTVTDPAAPAARFYRVVAPAQP